jgi:hypothetical protein
MDRAVWVADWSSDRREIDAALARRRGSVRGTIANAYLAGPSRDRKDCWSDRGPKPRFDIAGKNSAQVE